MDEMSYDLVGIVFRRTVGSGQCELRVYGNLVGIVDPGSLRWYPKTRQLAKRESSS